MTDSVEHSAESSPVCYHRHQVVEMTYLGMTSQGLKRSCKDCGASISVGYQCPLPELVPMPTPVPPGAQS
jgi:hypothetical protein